MYVEKDVFENVKCTVFDNDNSSKDNLNARRDLEELTNRSSLFLNGGSRQKPKATYTLTIEQRKVVCEWLKSLRFPDGHVSNIGRKVKVDTGEISRMRSHDCHVFMQRLLPIAFRDFLPKPIWETLTELSAFFRAICGTNISPSEMNILSRNIVETVCKLEKIFPPSFFDSVIHLIVHLPYEAMVAGPVFYRWMYPFERMMWLLKNKNMNKNHIEGSIIQEYLMKEVSNFCSFYFGTDVKPVTRVTHNSRTHAGPSFEGQLSICIPKGDPLGKATEKVMNAVLFNAAIMYIVRNCHEFGQYVRMFDAQLDGMMISNQERGYKRVNGLVDWLRQMHRVGNLYLDQKLVVLLMGGHEHVKTYNKYVCNGVQFHTQEYGRNKKTMCSGVSFITFGATYYGTLREILEITFYGLDVIPQKICLFRCDWYDNVRGVTVYPRHGLVDIDSSKKLNAIVPFLLPEQATQVYYADYPSSRMLQPTRRGIWAVCPTSARRVIDASIVIQTEDEAEYYQDLWPPPIFQLTDELSHFNVQNELADTNIGYIDVIGDVDEDDE